MGAGVSSWTLAREVSSLGQLGVVSGTALDSILVRKLWDGDAGGNARRAMAAFPSQEIVQSVLDRYFRAEGAASAASPAADTLTGDDGDEAAELVQGQRYKLAPLLRAPLKPERNGLLVLANFVEVFLAKEGHDGVVGINYLEKIQLPTLPSLYGAMLADVDVVLMGAGIPAEIPAVLDRLRAHLDVSISLDVLEAGDRKFELTFDPKSIGLGVGAADLRRPSFLPIVSAATLAKALLRKSPGGIDGFVVEGPIAGGHNAPPRGQLQLNDRGEPIYGDRDVVDLEQMKALGVPFWLAGAYGSRERFTQAIAAGARGVQVGTAFAFCEESGLDPDLRQRFLTSIAAGDGDVFTDPVASPTGFPFKVAELTGTLSDEAPYDERPRLCDLGYLRRAYVRADGTLDYRCPSEPVDDYVRKGGKAEDTVGRKCLCNALVTNIGMGQRRANGYLELPMLTAGDDIASVRAFISPGHLSYHARDVVASLLPVESTQPSA
jgi:NAD(P)H-dependent flavin oxidoreductase YrpB (nitropropane dioxygenase family)